MRNKIQSCHVNGVSFNTFWFVRLRLHVVQEAEYEGVVLDVDLSALVPRVVVVLQFT